MRRKSIDLFILLLEFRRYRQILYRFLSTDEAGRYVSRSTNVI